MQHTSLNPRIILSSEHGIERSSISSNALKVVNHLKSAGYSSEIVGGSIRDLLVGRQPKDFDVATNARPDQVRELFRRSYVIGRRFKIAEVRMNGECIQVATYRKSPVQHKRFRHSKNISGKGKILKDNRYGTIREDAFRRDLTINSLYLNSSDLSIVDYTGGYEDAKNGIVRVIGSASQRYREDPVRMLRAIRFATLPGFKFDEETEQQISSHARLLADVSNFRLADELSKMLFNGRAEASFEHLFHHHIFSTLFPPYYWLNSKSKNTHGIVDWIRLLLKETDQRVRSDEHTSLSYTLAAMLWPKFKNALSKRSKRKHPAHARIARGILDEQNQRTFLAGSLVHRIEDIWLLQMHLENGLAKGNSKIASHRSFRPAVRLLEMRSRAGEAGKKNCQTWIDLRDRQESQYQPRRRRHRRRSRSRA